MPIRNFISSVFDLLFPPVCLGCSSPAAAEEKLLCIQCRHDLPLTSYHLRKDNEVYKKFYGRIDLEFASAMLHYHKKGIVHELIHNLKYHGHQEIGTLLGKWYAEDLKSVPAARNFDVVVPVPLHRKRRRERGYNQVDAFSAALSEGLGIAFDSSVLVRNLYSKTQTKKTFSARTEVRDELFSASADVRNHGRHFVLVDDVITTGATLEACAKALSKIPGVRLSIISIADTRDMGF
ncbi:MAG TPA: ComF family protein [Flavobacterium sp.]|nr:ComF family protein [Flavobacterium sp.]